jgi:hypothetical protein
MPDNTIGNTSGTYIVTASDDSVIAVGNGNDTIDVSGGDDASITIGTGNDTLTATGGTGNNISIGDGKDSVTVSGGSGNTVTVGNGNDSVTTSGEADDTITVGDGNDTVTAGADSTISAGNGKDTLTAGANSAITAGTGNDTVTAGANSTIALGNGNDTVIGGDGDTITADNGNDTVSAGANSTTSLVPTLTTLVSFNGANPHAGLIADAAGDLFGTTPHDGAIGYGTVFEIAKTGTGYASTPTTLASFNFTDGAYPYGTLIADAAGDLFGTTAGGGTNSGDGTVFEIAKIGGSYASTPTTLLSFNGTNGEIPQAGLIADATGDLFGTTGYGGAYGFLGGTVFELTGTGFQVSSTSKYPPAEPGALGGEPLKAAIGGATRPQ